MSLINDALKKAQKQRTGEAPPLASMPAIGGESARHIARRAKPASFNSLLVRLGLGAGGLLVLGLTGVLLLRDSPAPAETPVAVAPAAPSASPAPAPAAPGQTKPAENVFVLPIAAPPVVGKPAPVSPKVEPTAPAAAVIQPETAKVAPAPTPAAPGRLEPRAMTYIDNIRVAGIRASATDSKVLMNDRVYRAGDTVEHELGLKLVGITANSLTFEDQAGGRYTRNF
jgi:hypothetical protein